MAQTWTFLAAYTPFDFIQNTSAYREMSLPLHLRLPEPRQGGDGHWLHKKPRIPPLPLLQLSCPIHYSGLSSVPANIHGTCELLPTGPHGHRPGPSSHPLCPGQLPPASKPPPWGHLASLQLVLYVPGRGTSDNINLNLPPSLHPCLKPLTVLRTKQKLLSAALIWLPLAHCLIPGCWPSSPPTLSVTGPLHMPFRLPGTPFPSACPLGVSALAGFPQGSGVLPLPEYRPFPPEHSRDPCPLFHTLVIITIFRLFNFHLSSQPAYNLPDGRDFILSTTTVPRSPAGPGS